MQMSSVFQTLLMAAWTLTLLLPHSSFMWQSAWRLLQSRAGDYAQVNSIKINEAGSPKRVYRCPPALIKPH